MVVGRFSSTNRRRASASRDCEFILRACFGPNIAITLIRKCFFSHLIFFSDFVDRWAFYRSDCDLAHVLLGATNGQCFHMDFQVSIKWFSYAFKLNHFI